MKSSKFALWRLYWFNYKDRGFVLPIAIGLGLIAVLVGTIMLTRSFRDQTNVLARQLATGSESLAELGVTRSLDLINQFRAIASVNACGGNWTSGECEDKTTQSWSTVGNPVTNKTSVRLATLINDLTNPATILSTNLTTLTDADIPSCTPSQVDTTAITNFANQLWQNSANNDGQFRLIDYRYDTKDKDNPDDGEGTLTIEGGIGQTSDSNTVTETAGTGITRLEVRFPVKLQPPWGLWIQQGLTASTGVKVDADVRDSRCGQSAAGINDFRTNIQVQGKNRSYVITQKNKNFVLRSGSSPINSVTLLPPQLILQPKQPRIDDPPNPRLLALPRAAYAGNQSTPSIRLIGKQLIVDAPGETREIYLEGSLSLTNSSIRVTKGTRLIIYLDPRAQFDLVNSSLQNDNDTPDGFQIYLYGDEGSLFTPSSFRISNSTLNNIFVFIPYVTFKQNSSVVKGTIWAKSWEASGSSQFSQSDKPPVLSRLVIAKPAIDPTPPKDPNLIPILEDISVNQINNISSWQRLPRN